MRQQSGEGEARKKRSKRTAGPQKTGFKKSELDVRDVMPDVMDDEIDPADFFDPEDFGIRRHVEPFRP